MTSVVSLEAALASPQRSHHRCGDVVTAVSAGRIAASHQEQRRRVLDDDASDMGRASLTPARRPLVDLEPQAREAGQDVVNARGLVFALPPLRRPLRRFAERPVHSSCCHPRPLARRSRTISKSKGNARRPRSARPASRHRALAIRQRDPTAASRRREVWDVRERPRDASPRPGQQICRGARWEVGSAPATTSRRVPRSCRSTRASRRPPTCACSSCSTSW